MELPPPVRTRYNAMTETVQERRDRQTQYEKGKENEKRSISA